MRCPDCVKRTDVLRHIEDETFTYDGEMITCQVPVWTCGQCGTEWTSGEAEDIRTDAIIKHLHERIKELEQKLASADRALTSVYETCDSQGYYKP